MTTELKIIAPLESATDPAAYGRKAFNLALLAGAGFKVPPGFVLPAGAPAEAAGAELAAAFSGLGGQAAVRSSAAGEDGAARSFAGQFDSYLGVNAAGLGKAVAACLASAANARAAAYGAAGGMAVIVQRLIDADISGVAFTCDPVSGDRTTIVIEAVRGLCEPLVSGRITPDHYELDKAGLWEKDRRVTGQDELLALDPAGGTRTLPVPEPLRQAPKLDAEQAAQVARAALRAETLFDGPVDIEWAFKGGELWLLQARPVTGI